MPMHAIIALSSLLQELELTQTTVEFLELLSANWYKFIIPTAVPKTLNPLKPSLFQVMNHEMRTPMHAMIALSSSLRESDLNL